MEDRTYAQPRSLQQLIGSLAAGRAGRKGSEPSEDSLPYYPVWKKQYSLLLLTNNFKQVCYCEGDLCNKNGIKGIDDDSVHFPDDSDGGAIVFPGGNVNQGNNGTNGTDTTSAAVK